MEDAQQRVVPVWRQFKVQIFSNSIVLLTDKVVKDKNGPDLQSFDKWLILKRTLTESTKSARENSQRQPPKLRNNNTLDYETIYSQSPQIVEKRKNKR
jgi:hypothetical protein